jgi:uncharacterized phage-associated protein
MKKVISVAAYILENFGPMTAMKLQKLVYYSQAWHMVWEDNTLFDSSIEAWKNGPVVMDLYRLHAGEFMMATTKLPVSDNTCLATGEKESIDLVCQHYNKFTAQQLSDKTHSEAPWLDARSDVTDGENSDTIISPDAIYEYYSNLEPLS